MGHTATESISQSIFHFPPGGTAKKKASVSTTESGFIPLFEGEHPEAVALRKDLFDRSCALLLHSAGQLMKGKEEKLSKKFLQLVDSGHFKERVTITIVPTAEYCPSIAQCTCKLKALKEVCQSRTADRIVIRLMDIELGEAHEFHRMILFLHSLEKPSVVVIVSPIGAHCLTFINRGTLLHCTVDESLEQEAGLDESIELDSFLESVLFNEQFPLVSWELLRILEAEFGQIHRSLGKTVQRLKFWLLEYYWGNPFSVFQAPGSIPGVSAFFLEFARMQPSFMQFVEDCFAESAPNSKEREKALRLLENEAYLVKALPTVVQCEYPAQMKALCRLLAVVSDCSPLRWYRELAKCAFSGKTFLECSALKMALNRLLAIPPGELSQIISPLLHMQFEFSFEDDFLLLCKKLMQELIERPVEVEDDRQDASEWRVKKKQLQLALLAQIETYFEPSFVYSEFLVLGCNAQTLASSLQLFHPDLRQGIDWALSTNKNVGFSRMYQLWKEYGRKINTYDWFVAYKQLRTGSIDGEQTDSTNRSIDAEQEKSMLGMFLHHVNEFEFLGLVERVGNNMNILKKVF